MHLTVQMEGRAVCILYLCRWVRGRNLLQAPPAVQVFELACICVLVLYMRVRVCSCGFEL